MKKLFPCFISIATMLCLSLFFSCSSNVDMPKDQQLSGTVCVYPELKFCLISEQPQTICPSDGELNDSCPFSSSSSGASGGKSSWQPASSTSNQQFCYFASTGQCYKTEASNCLLIEGKLQNSCPSVGKSSGSQQAYSSSTGGSVVPPGTGGPVSYYGKLKASGNKIVGSKTSGTAVQVRGVSLFWSNTGWGGDKFFTKSAVDAMVDDWKAEVIRVPIGYSEDGGYKNDPSNKTRVIAAIDAAIAKDVYVIIDWHSHNAHNETSVAMSFFSEMAQLYGNKDNVIFEIYNEPLNITWSTIKTYANSIISTIRSYSDNLILVGTPKWDQNVNDVVGNTLTDNNVAYVFHFYAYSHTLAYFQSNIDAVLNAGKPVFVSEYGTTHADGGNPEEYNYSTHSAANTNAWHTYMDSKKISSCAWSVNDKYEGSAFFGTGSSFNMSSWTNASYMTSSGKYIYDKLNAYANSAPWRGSSMIGSSSSGGSNITGYCDYGPETIYGGGCFPLSEEPCDLEWGWEVQTCGLFCDWGPINTYGGGCCPVASASDCKVADGGYLVDYCDKRTTTCPGN